MNLRLIGCQSSAENRKHIIIILELVWKHININKQLKKPQKIITRTVSREYCTVEILCTNAYNKPMAKIS